MSQSEKMLRGLSILHQDGEMTLRYRHHRMTGFFLLLAGLFWLVMLVPAGRVIFAGGAFGAWEAMAFFPFLGFAVGFGYVGLAKLLNDSRIAFSPHSVRVSHQPIPWFGAVELPMSRIEGYRVNRDLKPRDLRHRVTLALIADLDDRSEVALLRAISDSKAARRMHQEAQAYLEELRRAL